MFEPFKFNTVMELFHLVIEWLDTSSLKDTNDRNDKQVGESVTVTIISSHCNNGSGDSTKKFNGERKIIFAIIGNIVELNCSFKSDKALLI